MRRGRISGGYVNETRLKREMRRERSSLDRVRPSPDDEARNSSEPSSEVGARPEAASVKPNQPQKTRLKPQTTPASKSKPNKKPKKQQSGAKPRSPESSSSGQPSGKLIPDLTAERELVQKRVQELEKELFTEREKLRALDSLVNVMSGSFEPLQSGRRALIKNFDVEDAVFHDIDD